MMKGAPEIVLTKCSHYFKVSMKTVRTSPGGRYAAPSQLIRTQTWTEKILIRHPPLSPTPLPPWNPF